MSKRKTLDSWINDAISDPDKDGKCSMISLVHMVGQQQKEIHTTKFGSSKTWSSLDLSAMFRSKAEAYSQDLPGVQTFQLLAFYGEKTQPEAFQPFTINVTGDHSGLSTESPTDQGRLQQIMRQSEMLIQQVYRRQQVMDDYSLRLIEQQGNRIDTLSRENRDAFDIVKDMLMTQALNDHNRKMEGLRYERETGERKKLMGFAPALINTILGREVFPQSVADTALVESIADSLGEEDIMKLASVLKPEMMGPLAARLMMYEEKKNKEQTALRLAAGVKVRDPEADAAGDIVSVNGKA